MNDSNERSYGRYRLNRLLGHGALADVYLATDARLRLSVVLKSYKPELVQALSPEEIEDIRVRADRLMQLSHPAIVPLIDWGEYDGLFFVVTEYCAAEPLSVRAGSPQDFRQAACSLLAAAEGLAYAHSEGVLHGNIKPSNILVGSNGEVLLVDFMLFDVLNMIKKTDFIRSEKSALLSAYRTAEQPAEKTMDEKSDVFSLGLVFYEMLTGTKPCLREKDSQSHSFRPLTPPLPDIRKLAPGLPEPVVQVVYKATSRSSDRRYASAGDFGRALELLIHISPVPSQDMALELNPPGKESQIEPGNKLSDVKKEEIKALQTRRRYWRFTMALVIFLTICFIGSLVFYLFRMGFFNRVYSVGNKDFSLTILCEELSLCLLKMQNRLFTGRG